MSDRLRIRFEPGSRKAVALDVKVEVVNDETSEVVDISNLVRAADVRLHVGEAATASLEVFVSEVQTETLISEIKTLRIERRKFRRFRRLKDVTRFNPLGITEYV